MLGVGPESMLPHNHFKAVLAEARAAPRRRKPRDKAGSLRGRPPMLGDLKRSPSIFSSSSRLLMSSVEEGTAL